MAESKFQIALIKELRELFPGAFIFKNDTSFIQGIPDLTILYRNKWAMLECKDYAKARRQPNQPYYVQLLNDMSFASFIYPENKEEVLYELQRSFEA